MVYNSPPIFTFLRIRQFKRARLLECLRVIHSYALSLLFHFESWNYATIFARVHKHAIFTAKSKHYFCLDRVSHAMFSARFTANASVNSSCTQPLPPTPGLLRGICKFCVARGPGICQSRDYPRAFDTHAVTY